MKLDTKYKIGYKIWNWVQNMKFDTKYEIGYKIWNWIQYVKLGIKYEIGYKIRNWWQMYDKRKRQWSLLYVMHWYGTVGEGLLVEIVLRIDTWVNKYEPNSKSKSMRWRQTISPRRILKKNKLSAGKNRGYSFFLGGGGEKGTVLVNIVPSAAAVNCDRYTEPTETLNAVLRLRSVHPSRQMSSIISPHENASSHTSVNASDVITQFGWTVLLQTPCSPDFPPSHLHLRHVCSMHQWWLKHFFIQQIHKYIIRRYN